LKICCITIGNEILIGKTINTNLAYIGRELTKIGLYLSECITIPDEPFPIQQALHDAWERNDIVITTGGLGPTTDDITKHEIADFFGKEMVFSEEIWQYVQCRFRERGIAIPLINRNQAELPSDFIALHNIHGTAPGLYYQKEGKYFFAMPGVPMEMKYLFSEHIIPILHEKFPRPAVLIRTIHTFGIAESAIAEIMTDVQIPEGLNLAYLPQTGRVDLRVYGTNAEGFQKIKELIETRLREYIWGYDEVEPDSMLHELMLKSGRTLALAESCTGGMVQELITGHPDSSKYFIGGVVSYQNEVKHQLLNVADDDLIQYGAVSEQVAVQMARGVRDLLKTDIGAGITGIAGPSGGTDEKPVGTVHIAVTDGSITRHELMHFNGDRESIRRKSAEKCIFMIIDIVRQGRGN